MNQCLCLLLWLLPLCQAVSQTDSTATPLPAETSPVAPVPLPSEDPVPNNVAQKPLEFAIPVSAAFDLLGVNPASVMRPGNIRDFKVDWSFQSYRLQPNLAIQAQPVWELFYNRPNLRRYQRAPKLLKLLSTLDLSAGTIEQQVADQVFDRRLALAGKLTLLRSHDPLDQPELVREATTEYQEQAKRLLERERQLQDSLTCYPLSAATVVKRQQFLTELNQTSQELSDLSRQQKERLTQLAALFVKAHWNASFLDMAIGKAYTFDNPRLDSLKLTDDSWSVWVNGSLGLGRRWLVSALGRYTELQRPEARKNAVTQQYLIGLNLRYGGPKFNFFVEALNRSSKSPLTLDNLTIAYGGDWRFSRNVMLSYGVRTIYDQAFRFRNLVPVVSISCMMR
jgi:hypothetical protein